MKIIKILIASLLNLLLIDLIVLLVLNITLKDFMINEVIIESFKSNGELLKNGSNREPLIMDNEVIEKALEDEEIKELLDEFIDDIIVEMAEDESNGTNIEEFETKVIEYAKENKESIKEKTGIEITDEMIDEAAKKLEEGDTKKALEQGIDNYKNNMSKEEKLAFKVFNIITSEKTRIIIIISIILNIVLIAISQKSTYKWIRSLSRAMIISGISILILTMGLKYLITNLTLIVIKPKNILSIGIIITIIGIIINILYRVITKYYIKEKTNEIS